MPHATLWSHTLLHGKTAIVTGATGGIGGGIATMLAQAGARVMLHGFGTPQFDAAAWGATHNTQAAYFDGDLSQPATVEALVNATTAAFGQVDILVNNAGMQHVSPAEDFALDKWQSVIALNLSAAFYGIKYTVAGMKQRGYGRIINIASAHGLVASANKSAYVAAKHGLLGLTKSIGLETAGTGVTCNAVCPGWVLTPLVQAQIEARAARENISVADATHALLAEKQPSLQFVTAEQVGAYVVFLCSAQAAQVTGSVQSIDGGWTAQ